MGLVIEVSFPSRKHDFPSIRLGRRKPCRRLERFSSNNRHQSCAFLDTDQALHILCPCNASLTLMIVVIIASSLCPTETSI